MPNDTVYCDSCDSRFALSLINACATCGEYRCNPCNGDHNHDGDYCDGCGYTTTSDTAVTLCENCDQSYCDMQAYQHTRCRRGSMPRLTGLGNEASLDFMDEPYEAHPLAKGQRASAVELELEFIGSTGIRTFTLPDFYGVEHDGSLSQGVEVTTPPAKGAKLAHFVTAACERLVEAGFGPLPTCGMHVHIDLRDKKDDKRFLSHLFNAAFAFEDVLYAMQKDRRHTGTYSVPLRNTYKFFDMYGQQSGDFDFTFYKYEKTYANKQYVEGEKSRKYATVRYAAFNFHSVYYRGSLECRINQGESDPERALLWIDLIQAIIARVEEGHSYSFMTKWAGGGVTKEKVRAMVRYFKLDKRLAGYIASRIEEGQGWGFKLPVDIQWGTPVKGRPKGEPKPYHHMHRARFVNRRVMHNYCGYMFTLRQRMIDCPSCYRTLIDSYGEPRYTLAPPAPPRQRAERDAYTNTFNVQSASTAELTAELERLSEVFRNSNRR